MWCCTFWCSFSGPKIGTMDTWDCAEHVIIDLQVFRPSHILPTLTVEQQGEIEYRDAMRREQRQREAAAVIDAARADMTEEELEEEERLKAAVTDEFKDDNPYGWGNSKLRPCAL